MKIYIVLAGSGGVLDQRTVPLTDPGDEYGSDITGLLNELTAPGSGWSLRVGDSITIVQED